MQKTNETDMDKLLNIVNTILQNKNLDLPVIGIETVNSCLKSGFCSIVVSSKGTLILDYDAVIKYVKQKNFCIYAI